MQNYGGLAHTYDRMHNTWLRHAGGSAQYAFEAAVLAKLQPGLRVLDAGAGTGRFARHLVSTFGDDIELTLIDKSTEMLAQADDLECHKLVGDLTALPFVDGSFDLVSLAWAIEATPAPKKAITEAMRVLAPGGALVSVFCSDARAGSWAARAARFGVQKRGLGRFLKTRQILEELKACGTSQILQLRSEGPATVVLAQKTDRTLDVTRRRVGAICAGFDPKPKVTGASVA